MYMWIVLLCSKAVTMQNPPSFSTTCFLESCSWKYFGRGFKGYSSPLADQAVWQSKLDGYKVLQFGSNTLREREAWQGFSLQHVCQVSQLKLPQLVLTSQGNNVWWCQDEPGQTALVRQPLNVQVEPVCLQGNTWPRGHCHFIPTFSLHPCRQIHRWKEMSAQHRPSATALNGILGRWADAEYYRGWQLLPHFAFPGAFLCCCLAGAQFTISALSLHFWTPSRLWQEWGCQGMGARVGGNNKILDLDKVVMSQMREEFLPVSGFVQLPSQGFWRKRKKSVIYYLSHQTSIRW